MGLKGRFITFEGPEGAGKTTQIQGLARRLEGLGLRVILLREPGGTALGEWVRNVVKHDATGEALDGVTELFLFCAARRHLVERVIAPALDAGQWVICDRFLDSTAVYQGYAGGVALGVLNEVNRLAVGRCMPDRTLLMDLDVGVGLRRVAERASDRDGADSFEARGLAFHQKVREGYLDLAARDPKRFRVIRADRPTEVVAADIWERLRDYVA
ncbi:MAG: dTMP kinase [Verrucomicrobiota bacterium]|nr:dTMP kinase [Verrucomicrobiota bacterium]MDD8051771.1 dTMP kinase [Verrucomicrobiota bacterium]MDI9383383.1 dTMP kinase [Verrucomicrobiota bacterium]